MNSDQPVFVITIAGRDVTGYCRHWTFMDDEEGQSEIEVEMANPDMKLSGAFKYEDDLQIRFGYGNDMGGAAYLPVAEVTEHYPTGSELTVRVIGRDESQKLSGGKDKGVKGKDETDKKIIEKAAYDASVKAVTEGEDTKHKKTYVMNENPKEVVAKFGKNIRRKKGASGKSGTSPFGKSQKGGHRFSSAERIPEDGKDRDKNRGGNHSDQHRSEPVTGTLRLKGYPTLRAKGTVTVLGVGSAASGTYYVKKATHEWDLSGGYVSTADLIRSGWGSGGAGDATPTVAYADIWQKGQMYVGPRKMDGASQATFRYGAGENLVEFDFHVKPQRERHAGEGSEGEGIDLRKKGEDYKAEYEAKKASVANSEAGN